MWIYLGVLLFLTVVLGLVWLLRPYYQWKSNFHQQKKECIRILTKDDQCFTRQEFLDRKKDQKYQYSLIVPAYNEQQRMPVMLDEAVAYMKKVGVKYEIIVVNDGSKDKTTQVALNKARELKIDLFVVEYPKNRGKGGAIRAGMSVATGDFQLMVDADGATTFSELQKLIKKMQELQNQCNHPLIMVVGSRHHLTEETKVERKALRKFVAAVFKFLITVICGIHTKDTQCGFKLFTKQSAKALFETLHLERWAFDIQLFLICNKFKFVTAEIPVQWRDVDGSKLNVVEASISMFRDILLIRLLYILGFWKFTDKVTLK